MARDTDKPTKVIYYEGRWSNGRSSWLGPYYKGNGVPSQRWKYFLQLPVTNRDHMIEAIVHEYDLTKVVPNTRRIL